MAGSFLIISGPSGSGKSSLMNGLLESMDNIYFSISSTSRKIRDGEKDGVNYHFISEEEFKKDIEDGYFLEWALVHGNYYGTSIKHVQKALDEGKIVMLDIDVQGHKIIRDKLGDKISSIFITTPNGEILRQRLVDRKTDSQEVIDKRMFNAKEEMKRINEYDYLLINDDFAATLEEFKQLVRLLSHRVVNLDIEKFINLWNK